MSAAARGAYARHSPFTRATGEAPYTPRPLWLTADLALGIADDDAAAARDGAILDAWHETVGERDPVFILGGVGDPSWLAGLPGTLYLVAGPDDPMSVVALAPVLDEHSRRTEGREPDAAGARAEAIEARRAELVTDWRARGGFTSILTGYGAHVDDKRGIVHPRVREFVGLRENIIVTSRRERPGSAPDAPACISAAEVSIDEHLRPVRLEDARVR